MIDMDSIQTVCEQGKCTMCRSCEQVCPVNCISFVGDAYDTQFAICDKKRCVSCGKCLKACPQISFQSGSSPKQCYVAWSNDSQVRYASASGGIATEIYSFFYSKEYLFSGVFLNKDFIASYKLSRDAKDIESFQNSKYVESYTGSVYSQIGNALTNGDHVVFIGLPCHVAGLKGYLISNKIQPTLLTTVDIVCHGTTPAEYFRQHIAYIEKTKKRKPLKISFREPSEGTHTFTLSMQDNRGIFYKRKVYRNDLYQIGYHYGLTYRGNCYSCIYANASRQGDITISDFSGLGKEAPYNNLRKSVSCVLINTDKGRTLIENLIERKKIYAEERPLSEALKYEKQLNSPTPIHKERLIFLSHYRTTKDFERSMGIACRNIVLWNETRAFLHIDPIHSFLSRCLPSSMKRTIKTIFH